MKGPRDGTVRFIDTPNRTVEAAGSVFVYRDLGAAADSGVPLIALTHLGANLDSWDPEVVDPLAEGRRVVLIGYRGVGASTGVVRSDFASMAADAIAVINALGFSRVDLLGLSMGGMVAQAILKQAPQLVHRVVLAGSGPQGGPGLTRMTGVMIRGILRGMATATTPTTLLFFTRTPSGRRAAATYQARLKLRRTERDKAVTLAVLRAQLRAVKAWGDTQPLSAVTLGGLVLILHGDSDQMVPTENADLLQLRFPDAQVQIFSDSGHGVISQNRRAATDAIARFLST